MDHSNGSSVKLDTAPPQPHFNGHLLNSFMGDGREDFSDWCIGFEIAVRAEPTYNEYSFCTLLPTFLSGAAFTHWQNLSVVIKKDFKA